jgi:2-methylisocitrate lyase-like PEP mutase family enzyme
MEQAGQPLLSTGGFGSFASSFGLPDPGLANMSDVARRIIGTVGIPVIVDRVTGYGTVPDVQRTTREELARTGREVPRPQFASMLVGRVTPILPARELAEPGFRIVVSPVEPLAMTAWAIRQLTAVMPNEGRADTLVDQMWSFEEKKRLLRADTA